MENQDNINETYQSQNDDFDFGFDDFGQGGFKEYDNDAWGDCDPVLPDGFDFNPRYEAPRRINYKFDLMASYRRASDLVGRLELKRGMREYCMLAGTFIMGDFLEAFIVKHNLHIKKLWVCTLSLSLENIESLGNLIDGGYVEDLSVMVSDHFYAHEVRLPKHKNSIAYMLERLDKDNKYQLSVCTTHVKLYAFETVNGSKVVITGSANMRSSATLEQISIEENPDLYDFNIQILERIENEYKLINKRLPKPKLWQAMEGDL